MANNLAGATPAIAAPCANPRLAARIIAEPPLAWTVTKANSWRPSWHIARSTVWGIS